ncbi:Signal transduction histidine kinase, contains PAS domain [Halorhabdus sp. SVX81]|uniref:sensor histidine kinase n=1 Tax=Halorhabdus sp. SVX81 TaxID=2978283 RepID=UPI0023DACC0E|nr:histidine kinase N-terminal 7TM domain-containing protein [Halorhabdus sp. SVX81]WEL16214.1 Signal transduction histidine kinase, contains PAS domain [Halorhabdus sp. SVX81]
MVSQTLYIALVLAASGFAAAVAAWLWERERDFSTNLFLGIAVFQAVGGALVAAELFADSRSLSVLLYGGQNMLLALVTPAFFLFVLASLGYRRHLTRPVVIVVFGIFVVTGVLELTNPAHSLIWSEYTIEHSPFAYVVGEPTNLSLVLMLPQMAFYYVGMGLLGANILFGSGTRRTQTAALFVGFLPPFAIISVWSAGIIPGPLAGASVIGGTWTLAVVAWAVFRHQLLDIVPMARETIFEGLEEVVIVVDSQRRILDFNGAASETFPELATAEGTAIDTVLPALVDGGSKVTPSHTGDRKTTGTSDGTDDDDVENPFVESFTRHVDGEPREYAVSVTPIAVGDAPGGFAVVVRDVTDRRQRIRHLRQQTAQLERFAGTLSHDLRNPLSVARGRIDLAQETGDEAHLETAAAALERIDQLVEDTLALARKGQAIEDREPIELAALARTAWETVDTDGATLEVEPAGDITVYADHSRLRTVFENLFRNAVEHGSTNPDSQPRRAAFTDGTGADTQPRSTQRESESDVDPGSKSGDPLLRGGDSNTDEPQSEPTSERLAERDSNAGDASLTVRLGRTEHGFYVEDDGPGIPEDDREDVLEYGYTTDATGTGLGLAIVDAIANAHGWGVEIADGRDGGARIVFDEVDIVDDAAQAD